jgi:type IV secretion system protein VirB10
MSENEPIKETQIQDRTQRPRGVVPKNAQAWVLGIIALVMILIIFFSGGSTPPKEPHLTSPVPGGSFNSPTPATIVDFANRVDDRSKKLAETKAALEQEQKDLLARDGAQVRQADSGSGYYPPNYSSGYRTDDVRTSPPPKSPAELEREKREAQAPYASSIAISYRQTASPRLSPVSRNSGETGSTTKNASLLDILNSDALFASSVAAQAAPPSTSRIGSSLGNALAPTAPVPDPSPAKTAPPVPSVANQELAVKHYTLFEGSIIETALTNRLDATFSGPVVCIVTADVYSQSGRHLLIPRGTRAIGEVRQVDNLGQQRVAVSFHRLIFPNEQSIMLDQFVGLNQIGATGLRDQVNHHYLQIFGAAIAVGAISGLAQSNTNSGSGISEADVYRQGVSSSLAQSSMHILDRFLNVLPTFTIREGHRIKVYLSQDLELPEYSDEGGI